MLIDFDKYTAIIESRLRPERFKHSLNVADCAAKLAEKYGAVLVPSRKLFEDACRRTSASFWSVDGIHLTPAGNGLLAGEWLRCVKGAGNVPV